MVLLVQHRDIHSVVKSFPESAFLSRLLQAHTVLLVAGNEGM